MILLSKKTGDNTYFEFDKILASGYEIREDKDRIIQKFANGHRKSINSPYTDCEITINLGTFDLETTKTYLDNLTSGTYKYYSINDKQYKETDFIIKEKPEIIVENSASSNFIIEDFEVVLLKAGD